MTDIFLGNKVFVLVTGKTLNVDKKFMEHLKQQKPDLQEVKNVAECDYVLVFCPIVSQALTDIEAALKNLQDIAGSKPAVLVMLHHTFNKDYAVPDSSRAVKRKNLLTVDCLFHEDQGLLQCTKNAESLGKILSIIKPEQTNNMEIGPSKTESDMTSEIQNAPQIIRNSDVQNEQKASDHQPSGNQMNNTENIVPDSSRSVNRQNTITADCLLNEDQESVPCHENNGPFSKFANWIEGKTTRKSKNHQPSFIQMLKCPRLTYFTIISGKTLGHHVDIERKLQELIPGLQMVMKLEESDFILIFCPVVTQAGTDIVEALKMLNTQAGDKPAVLVVLHHTFNPELIVPDSSRLVNRQNTITVDCLFYEDQGLLKCHKNNEALSKVVNWLQG
ncbi:uncharacterized protein LOC132841192 isoform X2 [Tachysurus vachellii]|uniref:uncharacterized protein LOC132841192 isoform X2 n=1 Tax=Tachysurus vachellii TaxID=175792 RepID=UPI00296B417C|nr:uncharacterized protein LOC132841192 isoform X2 [Tachysurus vachellii]